MTELRSRRSFITQAMASATAVSLPAAVGASVEEVILSVGKKAPNGRVDEIAVFNLTDLRRLPSIEYETHTMWTSGQQKFRGILLRELLSSLGQDGAQSVILRAINDYSVEVPMNELTDEAPILAYELNGAPMSRREKGPLWIVYPYDRNIAYRNAEVFSRSVWQLDQLILR